MKIFENFPSDEELSNLPSGKESGLGYVYGVKCGEYVKIGSTFNPAARIPMIQKYAEKYSLHVSMVALSSLHVNYKENEIEIHQIFSDFRKSGTELFKISFFDFVSLLNSEKILFIKDYSLSKCNESKNELGNIGSKICFYRKKNKFSQEKLSRIMEVTRATIDNWEKGKNDPSASMAVKLAKLFGITVEELMK